MKCKNCGWCYLNSALSTDKVCCNPESINYNNIISEEQIEESGCDKGETIEAIDYKNMTAWEFASKYYM